MSASLAQLPGIGPGRARRLTDAGFGTVEDVASTPASELALRSGIPLNIATVVVEHARSLVGSALEAEAEAPAGSTEIIPFLTIRSAEQEPSAAPGARGLDVARRVEATLGLLRQARRHCRKHRSCRSRRQARRALRRLARALALVQRQILAEGLSTRGGEHLAERLDALDTDLVGFVATPPRKRDLRAMRRLARTTRHAVIA